METKKVKFASKKVIDTMLENGELVVKRDIPNIGKLVGPAEDTGKCGLIMGVMSDDILGKEHKLVFSRTYGCWRTGMWAIPNWLVELSEEVKE